MGTGWGEEGINKDCNEGQTSVDRVRGRVESHLEWDWPLFRIGMEEKREVRVEWKSKMKDVELLIVVAGTDCFPA